ncbi:MAG: succinate dehydrogenase cytochrome b subunit [Planctomycetes bacterium]|nr:succinate dehydrogenase cytochrome b subunit [Planctomycetota bacterium]
MNRALQFYRSTLGKKVVMAVTGVVLLGFLVGHVAGNLLVFAGAKKLDDYAHFLKANLGLLWGTRCVLLVCVTLHILTAIELWLTNRRARPIPYGETDVLQMGLGARTMMITGPLIAVFVVYHLLHFTLGTVHPSGAQFDATTVYANVVTGFQVGWTSLMYIAVMLLLGLHLVHGVWSMFQTAGVSHPVYTPLLRRLAVAVSILIALGFIAIPAAVLLGWVNLAGA